MAANSGSGKRTTEKKSKVVERSNADLVALIKSAKTPQTSSVDICLVPALADRRDELKRELGAAELVALRASAGQDDKDRVGGLLADYEAAVAAATEMTVPFRLEAVGSKAYEDLLKRHKPTRKQQDEFKAGLKELGVPSNEVLEFDPNRFPPALVQATVVSPEMTLEDVTEIWESDQWSRGELGTLFNAVIAVNQAVPR